MDLRNYQTMPIDRCAFQSLLDSQSLRSVQDTACIFERLGNLFLLQKVDDERLVVDDIIQWFDNEEFIGQIGSQFLAFVQEAEGVMSAEQIATLRFLFIKTIRIVMENL